MRVAHADNQNVSIFDYIEDDMRAKWMHPHWWGEFVAFAPHARIVRNQVEDIKQRIVITVSLFKAELDQPRVKYPDDVFVCRLGKPKPHGRLTTYPRVSMLQVASLPCSWR